MAEYGIIDSFLWYLGLAGLTLLACIAFTTYLRWNHQRNRSRPRRASTGFLGFGKKKDPRRPEQGQIGQGPGYTERSGYMERPGNMQGGSNNPNQGYLQGPQNYIMRILIPDERDTPYQPDAVRPTPPLSRETSIVIKTNKLVVQKKKSTISNDSDYSETEEVIPNQYVPSTDNTRQREGGELREKKRREEHVIEVSGPLGAEAKKITEEEIFRQVKPKPDPGSKK